MVSHTGHPIVAFFSSFQSRKWKSLFTSLSSLLSTHLRMPRPCLPHRRFLLQRRHSKTFVDWMYEFSAFMDTSIAYFLKILHIDFWFSHHLLENCLVQCDGYFALPLCYSNCTYIFSQKVIRGDNVSTCDLGFYILYRKQSCVDKTQKLPALRVMAYGTLSSLTILNKFWL